METGCSDETIQDYRRAYGHLSGWCTKNAKANLECLTTNDLRAFLAYLRTLKTRQGQFQIGGDHHLDNVARSWLSRLAVTNNNCSDFDGEAVHLAGEGGIMVGKLELDRYF